MKKLTYLFAFTLLLFSCAKENTRPQNQNQINIIGLAPAPVTDGYHLGGTVGDNVIDWNETSGFDQVVGTGSSTDGKFYSISGVAHEDNRNSLLFQSPRIEESDLNSLKAIFEEGQVVTEESQDGFSAIIKFDGVRYFSKSGRVNIEVGEIETNEILQDDYFDARIRLNDVVLETLDGSASVILNGVLLAPVFAHE